MASSSQINSFYLYRLRSQTLYLLPQKAIFWKDKKALILSDLHLGKAAHFRKSGIQVPESVHMSDYVKLKKLVENLRPELLILLGDLFHSDYNREWDTFMNWLRNLPPIAVQLVRGNHDILPEALYSLPGLNVYKESFSLPPFHFMHHSEKPHETLFTFSGHIHPSVRIREKARQSMVLPCFRFTKQQAILPAFGKFTGTATLHPSRDDEIFIVFENSIVKL